MDIHLEPNITLFDFFVEQEFHILIQLTISMIINSNNNDRAMSAAISAVTAQSLGFEDRCTIIRRLVDASFDLDLEILLHHASQPLHNSSYIYVDVWRMLEFLVDGFDFLEIDSQVSKAQTALRRSAKVKEIHDSDTVTKLIKYGVNLCDIDGNGSTVLHAFVRDEEIIGRILKVDKVNVNAKDQYGHTALYFAIKVKAHKTVDLLLIAGAWSDYRDVLEVIDVEAYKCIDSLLTASAQSKLIQLLQYILAAGKERMLEFVRAKDTMAELTEEEWDKLLENAVKEGKFWFVNRIVKHHKMTIDPALLQPLVSQAPEIGSKDWETCEVLRQALNEMKASMNGTLPERDLMPFQLARDHDRQDMVFLMEEFLQNESLSEVLTKVKHLQLIWRGKKRKQENGKSVDT
ncbi:hypothetical protein ACHAPM_010634 [Fusarium culmorum]